MTRPVIAWFRSDLRIHDNTALAAATRQGPVVAVFLRSLPHWQRHGHGANKLDFWGRGVAALRDRLSGLGIPLLHRDIDDFGEAPATLLAIARETGAGAPAMRQAPDLEVSCAFFNKLDKRCIEKLYEVYTDDVAFTDPRTTSRAVRRCKPTSAPCTTT